MRVKKPKLNVENIPTAIYDLRCRLGESQPVFGARFRVTGQAVSNWERGVREPPMRVVIWVVNDGRD